ncbi:MAG: hypothetical protein RMA76_17165 [Deltaproteobacteria bacterium]|jgi:hypothetical protein
MTISKTPPPLPKMLENGALVASEKECPWWPEPLHVAHAVEVIEGRTVHRGSNHRPGEQGVNQLNSEWVGGARNHLLNYVIPFSSGSHSTNRSASHGNTGLVSAALTRLRDDQVVHQSLPLTEAMEDGLARDQRDVMAAVALLVAVDERTRTTTFYPDTFEKADPKVDVAKIEKPAAN